MPAKAPPTGPQLKKLLRYLGSGIYRQRKRLGATAIGTAEAAGISRVTLHRIEKGEPSVTISAYYSVIAALGLSLDLVDRSHGTSDALALPKKIKPKDYPQLKSLAWQLDDKKDLTPKEALNLYERNWRHVRLEDMSPKERDLLQALVATFGKGRLLV